MDYTVDIIICQIRKLYDNELYTIAELHDKMVELSEDSPCYSEKSLKRKLIEHYEDHIFFVQQPGRPNLICFRNLAWFIMDEFKKIKSQTSLDIKSYIRELPCDKKEYPLINKLEDVEYAKTWVPERLLMFLKHLVSSPLKQVSIGQSITQCSRPWSMIASIPFGIGVFSRQTLPRKRCKLPDSSCAVHLSVD